MAAIRKSSGDPAFLTNGGLHVVTTGLVLAVVIDYLYSHYGSEVNLPKTGFFAFFSLLYGSFFMGSAMFLLTIAFWVGGHLRRRWQFWMQEAHVAPLLWTERPLWHLFKLLASTLAALAMIPFLALSLLGFLLPIEYYFVFYFYSLAVVSPSFVTCLLGLALADWLVVANVGMARAIASGQERGRTAHSVFLCTLYLFVLFDVVLLLPRSFLALLGSSKTPADLAVAATAPLLVVWAVIVWFRGRRTFLGLVP